MASVKLIPYSEEVRAADTENAMKTVKAALYPTDDNPIAVDFSGTCPRCGCALAQPREWLVAVAGSLKTNEKQLRALAEQLDNANGDETFDLKCTCASAHPKRPDGKQGCGATFRLRVVWP
jgi:hypothetical protein